MTGEITTCKHETVFEIRPGEFGHKVHKANPPQAGRIDEKFLRITMPDGSKWDVPVRKIAEDRARHYMNEFKSFEESYNEDTIPLFEEDHFEIQDWASNNMNWSEIAHFAKKAESHPMTEEDFQEGLVNGEKEIVEGKE